MRAGTDEQLFTCRPVKITVPEEDKPGRPARKSACTACGEQIQDAREVVKDGRTLCKACADGAYYQE
jgi:formylmethanofuran dehydrogenase subunit E